MKYGIQMETREWMPRDRFLLVTAQQLAEIDATIARLARLLLR